MSDTLHLDEWLDLPTPRNGKALAEEIVTALADRDVLGSVVGLLGDGAKGQLGWLEDASAADKRWARRRIAQVIERHDPDAKSADELDEEANQAEDTELADLEGSAIPEVAKLAKILRRERSKRRSVRVNERRNAGGRRPRA